MPVFQVPADLKHPQALFYGVGKLGDAFKQGLLLFFCFFNERKEKKT
jgi:hypothetical protein